MKKITPINKDIKNIKKLSKAILITLLKAIVLLIKNLLYITYLLIYNFNNFIGNLYLKMPRIIRVGVIYTLLFMAMVNFITIDKTEAKNGNIEFILMTIPKTEYSEVAIATETDKQEDPHNNKEVEETSKKETSCSLGKIECQIYNKAIEKGMSHEQGLLAIAISRHETANWTSRAFKNLHNYGGNYINGKLHKYNSFEEGQDSFLDILNNVYYKKGLTTIEKIQPKYAPIGAKNDPNDQNQNWVPVVTKYYNEYLNK